MDERQQQAVARLQERDRQVRAHEQAHLAAAGPIAVSAAQYEYVTGPDGRRYAVGGEVRIDVSKGRTPEETIRKAQAVRRVALAPAQPSGQDRAVAAATARMESEARAELVRQTSWADGEKERTVDSASGIGGATEVESTAEAGRTVRAVHSGAGRWVAAAFARGEAGPEPLRHRGQYIDFSA